MNPILSLKMVAGEKTISTDTFDIPEAKNEFVWHHFFKPTEEELKVLPEAYGLHPLSIEDCMDDDQIPKIESFATYTHILFNTFHANGDEWQAEEVNIFVGGNFLVSVTRSEILNSVITKTAERLQSAENGTWKNGPSWLLHLLLDKIVDEKMIALEALEDELDALEDKLLVNSESLNFLRIQQLRNAFVLLRKSLFHEREILAKTIRNDIEFID